MFGGKGTFNYDKLEKGYELPVEYTFQCDNRFTCEKIVEFRKKKIEHLKEISGMGNLLNKSLDNFQANESWQQYCKDIVQSYLNDSKLAIKKIIHCRGCCLWAKLALVRLIYVQSLRMD